METNEIIYLVEKFNGTIYQERMPIDSLYDANFLIMEYATDGGTSLIKFMGEIIWSDDDDEREYINEEEDIREPLEDFIYRKIELNLEILTKYFKIIKENKKNEWK